MTSLTAAEGWILILILDNAGYDACRQVAILLPTRLSDERWPAVPAPLLAAY